MISMRIPTGYENRRARIEMVPLIDVVFLLIVFFIYTSVTMTAYRGVRVSLPHGEGMPEKPGPVVLVIAADNTLSLDGRSLPVGDAVAEVRRRMSVETRPVLVRGDGASDLRTAVELLSALRSGGVESVSFQVEREARK